MKAVRWRAIERVNPLVLSDSAGIGYSPQELSQSAMGCSFNGIEMSVVFVSGDGLGRKSKPAQQEAR